jgi:predicted amidophosphoribosyltransferase
LDKLGELIQNNMNIPYIPSILYKTRAHKKFSTGVLKKQDREKELEGVYQVHTGNWDLNHKNVLILDDVSTSNTTANAIRKALLEKYPDGNFYLFALGKTDSGEDCSKENQEKVKTFLNYYYNPK